MPFTSLMLENCLKTFDMISIIIPVYNVAKYLPNCLKSISVQTFIDFEVLLIDDGSTDKSGEICDNYCKIDNRFKVYHKQNGGVSSARNYALDKITGEWVYFCDADDLLYEDTLQTLLVEVGDNIDCTMGGYISMTENGDILMKNEIIETTVMSIEDALIDFYNPKYTLFNVYIWNRLFKRSIIQKYNLQFREDLFIKEDGLFLVQYLCRCKGLLVYNTKPVYKYIKHSSSVMNSSLKSINPKSLSRLVGHIECYKEITKSPYKKVRPLAKSHIYQINGSLFYLARHNNRIIKDYIKVMNVSFKELSLAWTLKLLISNIYTTIKIKLSKLAGHR